MDLRLAVHEFVNQGRELLEQNGSDNPKETRWLDQSFMCLRYSSIYSTKRWLNGNSECLFAQYNPHLLPPLDSPEQPRKSDKS